MDFGHGEKEFWHTWWPHNEDRFNTPEFKEVLQRFVDDLRQTGLLKNLGAMDAYCWQHGGVMAILRKQKITVSVYAVLPFPASIRGTSIAMIFASRRCTDRNTLW